MKKKLALVLCAMLTVTSLAACSKKGTGDSKSETKGDVLTIEFFQQKGEEGPQKGYKTIIDKFNAENPDIKIEMNTVPDPGTVLTSRISSGDIPVIFSDYPTQQQYLFT